MKLSELLVIPFVLQGLAMMVDEFYFHRKRGLPRWERIGHPLDTLTVLASYSCVLFLPPTTSFISLFVGISIFSCIFVTKDEFVHKEKCSAAEQWLHSVLFILHPIGFAVIGWIWVQQNLPTELSLFFWTSIQVQGCLILGFLFYQIFYWNVVWKIKRA